MRRYTKEDVKAMLDSLNRTLELGGYEQRYKITSWESQKETLCALVDLESHRQISPNVLVTDMHDILATIQNFICYTDKE